MKNKTNVKNKSIKINTSSRNKKKNNKKDSQGFTLIEIVGVIIIIGVIMIIGTVAVSGYIESSKARTYDSYKKDLEGATDNLMIECISGNEEGCDIPEYGRDIKISYNELVDKGYSDRLKDPEGEGYCDKSYVIAKNTSENGVELEYQVCLYCSKYKSEEAGCEETGGSDGVPPTCDYSELTGASTEWTNKDRVISIGCKDGESGCQNRIFSSSIGKEGEVIEKGTITIRDNAGNETECEVDAYVDKVKPSCRLEVEGEGTNGWYRPGIKVKMESTTDEGSGVAEYGMGSSLMNRDYNGKEEYEVKGGIITVFGYVKDKAGNEGYCSVEVKVDDSVPEGEVNMGYEIYPKEDSTKSGTEITISNTGEYGEIKGVIIYFNKEVTGSYASSVRDEKGNNIKSSGGVVNGRDKAILKVKEGKYEELEIYIGSSNVISSIEKVEVLKEETETSVWTNKDVSVYVDARDTITGVDGYSYDNGGSYSKEEIKTYSSNTSGVVKIRDKVGNVSEGISYRINKIDKAKPSCSLSGSGTVGNDSWYRSNVVIGFETASDSGGSGVESKGIGDYSTLTKTQTKDTSGTTYTGYIRDKAGNTNTCSITIKKDATKPSCSLTTSGTKGSNGWYTGDVTISIGSKSDATSGVDVAGVGSYTNGATQSQTSDTTGKTYTGYIRDKAGNTNTCTTTVKRDTVAPTITYRSLTYQKSTTGSGVDNWLEVGIKESYSYNNLSAYYIHCYESLYSKCAGMLGITKYSQLGTTNTWNLGVESAGNVQGKLGFGLNYRNVDDLHVYMKVCDQAGNCTCKYYELGWEYAAREPSDYWHKEHNLAC